MRVIHQIPTFCVKEEVIVNGQKVKEAIEKAGFSDGVFNKIQAIKNLRETEHIGLRNAKAIIDWVIEHGMEKFYKEEYIEVVGVDVPSPDINS